MLHTLDETLDKSFTDKYKSFIDEYEEEYEKIKNELENLKKTGWKISLSIYLEIKTFKKLFSI